jgi:hypothetical protein
MNRKPFRCVKKSKQKIIKKLKLINKKQIGVLNNEK